MYENVVNGKYLIKNVLAACIEKERQLGRAGIIHIHEMHYYLTAHKHALLYGKQHDQVHVCHIKGL